MAGVIGFRMIGSDSCGIIGFNQNSSNMRDGIYHLSHAGNTRVLTKHFNVQNVNISFSLEPLIFVVWGCTNENVLNRIGRNIKG